MRKRTGMALVAAGLVAGLALGTLGIASAVTGSATATAAISAVRPDGPPGGRGFGRGGGGLASSVATLTGLSVEEVMTQRQAGKSFAEIAKAKGVSAADVVSRALKDATADLKTRLGSEVNETGEMGPGGRGGHGGPGGPGGFGPPSARDTATVDGGAPTN